MREEKNEMADYPSLDGSSNGLKIEFKRPLDQTAANILLINVTSTAKVNTASITSKEWISNSSGMVGVILAFQKEAHMMALDDSIRANLGRGNFEPIKAVITIQNDSFVDLLSESVNDGEIGHATGAKKENHLQSQPVVERSSSEQRTSPRDDEHTNATTTPRETEATAREEHSQPDSLAAEGNRVLELLLNKPLNDVDIDPLVFYLESTVDSGGGDLVLDSFKFCPVNNVVTVEFESAETKERLLKKSVLEFNNGYYKMHINSPIDRERDFTLDKKMMILANVDWNEPIDLVKTMANGYAQKQNVAPNPAVKTVKSNFFKDTFYIHFNNELDLEMVAKRIAKRPMLHGKAAQLVKAFKSNMVLLRDPACSELKTKIDAIEAFLRALSKSSGDQQKTFEFVTLRLMEPYLIIKCAPDSDLSALLESDIQIEGHKYLVEPLYNFDTLEEDIKNIKTRPVPEPKMSSAPLGGMPPSPPKPAPPAEIFFRNYFKNEPEDKTEFSWELKDALVENTCHDEQPADDNRTIKVTISIPANSAHCARILAIEYKDRIAKELGLSEPKLSDSAFEMSGSARNVNKALNDMKNELKTLTYKDHTTQGVDFNTFFVKKKLSVSKRLKDAGINAVVMPSLKSPLLRIWSMKSDSDDIDKCIEFIKENVKLTEYKVPSAKLSEFKQFVGSANKNKQDVFIVEPKEGQDKEMFKIVGIKDAVDQTFNEIAGTFGASNI